MRETKRQRYLVITVDAEALPRRAERDHYARLVWGRHPEGTAGLGELVAAAETVGAPLTVFVEMSAERLYGQPLRDAVRWLVDRGQEVALHLHPEILDREFWREAGLAKPYGLQDGYPQAQADYLIEHFARRLEALSGRPPVAYRAGAFRWNANTLRAMARAGIPLSFNNAAAAARDGKRFVHHEATPHIFEWDNGVIEVPYTEYPSAGGHLLFEFPERPYLWMDHGRFLRRLFQREPERQVAVLLIHSWSFLYKDRASGHFRYRDERRLRRFRAFLEQAAEHCEIVTARDLLGKIRAGELPPRFVRPLAAVEYQPPAKAG